VQGVHFGVSVNISETFTTPTPSESTSESEVLADQRDPSRMPDKTDVARIDKRAQELPSQPFIKRAPRIARSALFGVLFVTAIFITISGVLLSFSDGQAQR